MNFGEYGRAGCSLLFGQTQESAPTVKRQDYCPFIPFYSLYTFDLRKLIILLFFPNVGLMLKLDVVFNHEVAHVFQQVAGEDEVGEAFVF